MQHTAINSRLEADWPMEEHKGDPCSSSADKYGSDCRVRVKKGKLPASELLEVCKRLHSHGAWDQWPAALVRELAEKLAGRIEGITGRGSPANAEGLQAYVRILPGFEQYANREEWVQELVDPVYVVADLATGPGTPAALMQPALPAPYPPPSGYLNPLVPLGMGVWSFPGGRSGLSAAMHFVGALQQANANLAVKVFVSTTPIMEL